MTGNKHPTPITIVDRPRIAFNIFHSLEGREFARKEDPSVVYEDNAHGMVALCAAIGEAKRGKVTGSCMNAEKLMAQCFTFRGLLDKHARTYCRSAGSSLLGRACHGPSNRCQRCVRIQFDPAGAGSHTQLSPELIEVHRNRGRVIVLEEGDSPLRIGGPIAIKVAP
jgi:hypothetical protein